MEQTFQLRLITPLFSRGAYESIPEIRAPSIRGQLHWWFRALHQNSDGQNSIEVFDLEREIFGGITAVRSKIPEQASRIMVRVLPPENLERSSAATLPHKRGSDAANKAAIPPGQTVQLSVLSRRGVLPERLAQPLERSLRAWLLFGALGNRSNRGAGSFEVISGLKRVPCNVTDYQWEIDTVLKDTAMRGWILPTLYASPHEARIVCTDTIGGPKRDQRENSDLDRIKSALGHVKRSERKTSPLKLRVVSIGTQFRILAIWDGRKAVTGNSFSDLQTVAHLLHRAGKLLGTDLLKVL